MAYNTETQWLLTLVEVFRENVHFLPYDLQVKGRKKATGEFS